MTYAVLHCHLHSLYLVKWRAAAKHDNGSVYCNIKSPVIPKSILEFVGPLRRRALQGKFRFMSVKIKAVYVYT